MCFCFRQSSNPNNWEAYLGLHNLIYTSGATRCKVSRIVSHEDYSASTLVNDIAIMFLDEKVDTSDIIIPACLPDYEANVGETCAVTGWGTLSSGIIFRLFLFNDVLAMLTINENTTPKIYTSQNF